MTVAGKLILKSCGKWTELDREMNDVKHLAPIQSKQKTKQYLHPKKSE